MDSGHLDTWVPKAGIFQFGRVPLDRCSHPRQQLLVIFSQTYPSSWPCVPPSLWSVPFNAYSYSDSHIFSFFLSLFLSFSHFSLPTLSRLAFINQNIYKMTNNGTTSPPNETEDISLASSPTLTNDSCSPSRPTFGRALSSDLTVTQNTLTLRAPVPYPLPSTSSAPKETQHTLQPPHAQEYEHKHDPGHHHIHLHDLVPESPIDGGLKGWLAVLGSFLIHCFAFAPTEFIFGIFELHYHSVFPDATSSSIAFVGTTGSAVTYIAGFLSGIVADRFGFRSTALCGTVVMTISLVLASFSTKVHPYLYLQTHTHTHKHKHINTQTNTRRSFTLAFNPMTFAHIQNYLYQLSFPRKSFAPELILLLNALRLFHTRTAGSSEGAYLSSLPFLLCSSEPSLLP